MSAAGLSQLVARRLPIVRNALEYTGVKAINDTIAGFSVALTVIPQSMAIAYVAGLQPQYGLYTSFISCFVYAVLGTRKEVTIGPTVVGAVLMAPYVAEFGTSIATLISFYSGTIIILGAIFNLVWLIDLVSAPTMAGFMSAAGLTVIAGQLPALLGIRAGGVTFLTAMIAVFDNIEQTRLWDSVLGVSSMLVILALMFLQVYAENYEATSQRQKAFRIFMRYLALSRNAIVVVLSTIIIANVTQANEEPPVYVTGKIVEGLPGFHPPEFIISRGNETLSVPQAARTLAPTILVPIIMVLEAITTLHAFTKGKKVDMRQEIFIIGLCNFFNSFFSGFYISGSVTRSAINNSSGVRTPFGGIITGTLVILVLSFLTGSLYYLPNATLASVIVVAIAFIVQIHNETRRFWKNGHRREILPMWVAFLACMFLGLDLGMIIGLSFNALLVVYDAATPQMHHVMTKSPLGDSAPDNGTGGEKAMVFTIDQGITYAAAERFRTNVTNHVIREQPKVIVLNGELVTYLDYTAGKLIKFLYADMRQLGHTVYFWQWKHELKEQLAKQAEVAAEDFRTTLDFEPTTTLNLY